MEDFSVPASSGPRTALVSEITELLEADQADRTSGAFHTDREAVHKRDELRLVRAREIYAEIDSLILSPHSLWQLAMLFQHGSQPEDYLKAQNLARMSAKEGHEPASWLEAAAEDRYLLAIGQKQKWGTQFIKNDNGDYEQEPMFDDQESGITDQMRQERRIPARADQLTSYLSGE